MALRATIATAGAVVWGALLAWHIAMDLRYVDTWQNDRDYRPLFDPAIAKLGKRLDQLEADRVISVDWGLHQPLVTLADRDRAAHYREWTWRLIDAPDLERDDLRRAVAQDVTGKRVAFVLHAAGLHGVRRRAQAPRRAARARQAVRQDRRRIRERGRQAAVHDRRRRLQELSEEALSLEPESAHREVRRRSPR